MLPRKSRVCSIQFKTAIAPPIEVGATSKGGRTPGWNERCIGSEGWLAHVIQGG